MPDMRDELVTRCGLTSTYPLTSKQVGVVLDSIPPGSYKLDEKTWVRLRRLRQVARTFEPTVVVYTEVDHAE